MLYLTLLQGRGVMLEGRRLATRLLALRFDKDKEGTSDNKHNFNRSKSFSCSRDAIIMDVSILNSTEGREAVHCVAPVSSKLAALEDVGRARPAPVTLDLDLDLQSRRSATRDAETITEVCSGGDLPEVEIISLLEEQIPRYKLRADTLTEFGGYENQDWFIPSPALKLEDGDLKLSPDQIRETLNYFLLCSNRVSQMTKTYNDIEAVTRLLEEKEKDIELTARIGKDLLTYNTKLESDVASLQAELKSANEKITQLTHELHKKTELIQVLTNDMDETGSETSTPTGIRTINLDLMQKRIGSLEEENRALRREYSKLADDTDECEAQEQRLVNDITLRLATVNMDIGALTDELDRQKEENRLQHEQILTLQAKLSDAEMRLHKFTMENEEVSGLLSITKENQASLATELVDFKERYDEVVGLLREAQEQLRKQRRKGMPTVRGGALFPYLSNTATGQPDSLQSELESSMHSELSVDSGISNNDKTPSYKKVFETVRCASRSSLGSSDGSMYGGSVGSGGSVGAGHNQGLFPRPPPHLQTGSSTMMMTSTLSSSAQPRMSSIAHTSTSAAVRRYSGSMYSTGSLGYPSLDSAGHSDNESQQSEDYYPAGPQPGIPGVPGATELEAALRRLTPAEVSARRATLQHSSGYGYDSDGISYLPFGCRTPDSIMSTGSSGLSAFSSHSTGNAWKLPEKLQIVKPLEGSQTLHHWAQLATPTLSGLLDERPGVKIRGGRELEDIGLETYALSDLEEDDEYANPGKRFDSSTCVYTYTMSTVMHPDDGTTSVTHSVRGSRLASMCASEQNSAPPTPTCLTRRNSTSTFSTTLGLAKMLNERGIKAVTPSALSTPSGVNSFTPTATPCNSPDGTPPPSRSTSPPPYNPLRLPGILGTGAEMLRRTITGDDRAASSSVSRSRSKRGKLALSRTDKKALSGMRIVEKIERIGLDSIMAVTTSTLSPLALQGALYTRRSHSSPMAQLTCLKSTMTPSTSQEQLLDKPDMSKKPPLPPSVHREKTPAPSLGVPGRPGTGALNKRLDQLAARQHRRQSGSSTRPDLGQVLGTVPQNGPKASAVEQASLASTTLGTISSLLFGRKGGLL